MSDARHIILNCGNELWLKPPLPRLGDPLWCSRCQDYCEVGPGIVRKAESYFPDYDWTSKPHPAGGWVGECQQEDCDERSHEKRNWYLLKERMEKHHLRAHSNSRFAVTATVPIPRRLPRNSPPPF